VRPKPGGGAMRVTVTLVRAGEPIDRGSLTLETGLDEGVELTLSARGQDYALLAGDGRGEPSLVATIDGRILDPFSAGGFLGVWIGAYATSWGAETDSVVRLDSVEYRALS